MSSLVSSLFVPLVSIILPVFGLILAGYVCRKSKRLGPNAASEINRFVVYLALPALLFDIMARTPWRALDQPGFIGAFGIGSGAIFGLTLLLRLLSWNRGNGRSRGLSDDGSHAHAAARRPRHLADASIDGLNAAYPNTGFVGIPLCLLAFGQGSLAPAVVATIITVCVLFACAIVLIELSLQTERRLGATLGKVARSLLTNPLLVAPLAGALWSGTGLPLSGGAEAFLKLLGGAASPCALVALGLFLGQKAGARDPKVVTGLVALKLVAQPLLTWWLAFHVFDLAPLWANTAVILSALPTGTGPFMLAEFYRREAGITSNTILISTVVSLVTVTICLGLMLR